MSEQRKTTALGWVGWILLVLLLAALAGGGYFGWQLQRRQSADRGAVARLTGRADALAQALAAQRAAGLQLAQRLQAEDQRLQTLEQSQSQLRTELGGGAERARLYSVEQLLALAVNRAQLADDAVGARRALAAADRRLASIDDPALVDVRKAIAAEQAQLAKVAVPDYDGTALALQQLAAKIPELPLAARPAAGPEPAPTASAAPPARASWWQRAAGALDRALGSLFRIRHLDHSLQPALTPAQAEMVRAVLSAQLATAQAALLAHDDPTFHASLRAASGWIATHFLTSDPAVTAVRNRLDGLVAMQLSPKLPALGDGLAKLRAHLAGSN